MFLREAGILISCYVQYFSRNVADPVQRESAEGLVAKVFQILLETVWTDHFIRHSFGEGITNIKKYYRFFCVF